METKVLQVFYGKDCLPYKDKERSVHFPIVGAAIKGASNTTKIRFYFDQLIEEDDQTTTWVVVSKLPNGKIGSEIVETELDSELNEHYASFSLKNFYTQAKGDLFLSLQGYQGGVQVETNPDTGISQIIGTPTIQATGSIKLAINYATQLVGSGETANINFQKILADLGTKLGIRAYTERVTELPTVGETNVFYAIYDDTNDPNKLNIYVWNGTTQSYVWVGDNTLYLGEYYTKEQGEQFEIGIDNRVTSVENELSSVASGSPKGVYDTLSDLETAYPTGTTGIFVVLEDGHWYYWNGNAWTDGGTYLASAADKGLSVSSINSVENQAITNTIAIKYPNVELELGYINGTTGAKETSNLSCITTKAYFLRKGTKIVLLNSYYNYNFIYRIAKYTCETISASNCIQVYQLDQGYYSFDVPNDGYYAIQFAVLIGVNVTQDDMDSIINALTFENLNSINSNSFEKEIKELNLNFVFGSMATNGYWSVVPNSGTNYRNVISRRIRKEEFSKIKIKLKPGFQFLYVTFNGPTFVSRSSWQTNNAEIELDNTYDLYIVVALADATTEVLDGPEYVSCGVDIELVNDNLYENKIIKKEQIDFVNKIAFANYNKKTYHLSFDDVWHMFYELQKGNYNSIFEIPFIQWAVSMHNTYGVKMTLNCFTNNDAVSPAYDMSLIPNTFAAEFQSISSWLKLSFHSKNTSDNYSTNVYSKLKEDYENFITIVKGFTGGNTNCIDTVVRLGYFAGSKKQIEDIANVSECPIKGLLTADDTRVSYYFDKEQNDRVIKNYFLVDTDTKLYFVRSQIRLDTDVVSQVEQIISNNGFAQKYVELFCHLTSVYLDATQRQYVESMLIYLQENDYESNFLKDIFD